MNLSNFRILLDVTSGPLSLIHPSLRLAIARAIKSEAIRTVLDPNSINSRHKNRFGDVNKEVRLGVDGKLFVNINEMIGYRSSLDSNWDSTTLRIAELLKFDDLFYIDIGANIGATLIPIAAKGSRCIAFEPNLDVAWRLLINVSINRCDKVEIFLNALADIELKDSWMHLKVDAGNSGAASLFDGTITEQHTQTVKITTLDDAVSRDFLNSLETCRGKLLLKVDVEGYEAKVIQGALSTIKTFSPVIILEHNPGKELQTVLVELELLGYQIYAISEDLLLSEVNTSTRYENIVAIPQWAMDLFTNFTK